jgi:beta-galactosidase
MAEDMHGTPGDPRNIFSRLFLILLSHMRQLVTAIQHFFRTEKEVKHARPHTRAVSWKIDESTNHGVIECRQRVAPVLLEWSIDTTTTYTFGEDSVAIRVQGKPRSRNLPQTLPRLGLTLALPPDFASATWFGRGPGESYRDKKHAQRFGLYTSAVSELSIDYEYPQESGNRTDTRWVRFHTDSVDDDETKEESRKALVAQFIDKPEGFDFQASHLHAHDVERATHIYELGPYRVPEVIVRLDAEHHGLGSESCGKLVS